MNASHFTSTYRLPPVLAAAHAEVLYALASAGLLGPVLSLQPSAMAHAFEHLAYAAECLPSVAVDWGQSSSPLAVVLSCTPQVRTAHVGKPPRELPMKERPYIRFNRLQEIWKELYYPYVTIDAATESAHVAAALVGSGCMPAMLQELLRCDDWEEQDEQASVWLSHPAWRVSRHQPFCLLHKVWAVCAEHC